MYLRGFVFDFLSSHKHSWRSIQVLTPHPTETYRFHILCAHYQCQHFGKMKQFDKKMNQTICPVIRELRHS